MKYLAGLISLFALTPAWAQSFSPHVWIDGSPGTFRTLEFTSDGVRRVNLGTDATPEGGSSTGSNFQINLFNDSGGFARTALFIGRHDGNVGVGTLGTSYKLAVDSGASSYAFRARSAGDFIFALAGDGIAGSNLDLFSIRNNNTGAVHINSLNGARLFLGASYNTGAGSLAGTLVVTPEGNAGIGTASPSARVHVRDGDVLVEGGTGGTSNRIILKTVDNADVSKFLGTESYWTVIGAHGNEGWKFKDSSGDVLMQINGLGDNNGYVGVGTSNPTHKLSVNGAVRAKEIIVDTGWSDYVFAQGYELAPLSEVEAHIKEHQHLPGIPSAKEVSEQGVSLGEMQAKLLAKIEELTLHVIAQQKLITQQRNEMSKLHKQVVHLASALEEKAQ